MDLRKKLDRFLAQFQLQENFFSILRPYAPCYIVGGWIRDTLLDQNCLDLDLIVTDPAMVAYQLGKLLKGKVICLDEDHQIYRIVLIRLPLTIDLAPLYRENLTEDMKHRDITINAIACDLFQPDYLIDPCDGRTDLDQRLIRAVSSDSFQGDSLRVFRVFRFAAKLNFSIDPLIFPQMEEVKDSITQIAGERVFYELSLFLTGRNPSPYIPSFLFSAILSSFCGRINFMPAMDEAAFSQLFERIEASDPIQGFNPASDIQFSDRYFVDGRKLLLLIHLFWGYYREIMPILLSKLKINHFLTTKLNHSHRILKLLDDAREFSSLQEQTLEMIADYGEWIMILFYYDYLRDLLSHHPVSIWEAIIRVYQAKWKVNLCKPCWIDGSILKSEYHLQPGPLYKTILRKIKIETIRGVIKNKTDATEQITSIITNLPAPEKLHDYS